MVSSRRHHRRLSILSKINLAIATGSSWQYYKPFNSSQDQLVQYQHFQHFYTCSFNSILDQLWRKGRLMSMSQRPFNSILDQRSFTIMALLSSCCDFQFYPRSTHSPETLKDPERTLSILSKINSDQPWAMLIGIVVAFNSIQDQRSWMESWN